MNNSRSITVFVVSSSSQIQNTITVRQVMVTVVPFSQVKEKRSSLFAPRKARSSKRATSATGTGRILLSSRMKPGSITWTACLVYLAESLATKLTNPVQKQILQKTGLSCKVLEHLNCPMETKTLKSHVGQDKRVCQPYLIIVTMIVAALTIYQKFKFKWKQNKIHCII